MANENSRIFNPRVKREGKFVQKFLDFDTAGYCNPTARKEFCTFWGYFDFLRQYNQRVADALREKVKQSNKVTNVHITLIQLFQVSLKNEVLLQR